MPSVTTGLETLVRDFESDAAGNQKLIRGLLADDREGFYANAIGLLKSAEPASDSGRRDLIGLLISSGLLLRALCDPKLAKEEAMALARAATHADPLADAALARGLADSAGSNGGPVPMEAAPRLMEILAGISDGGRILPWMMRLMRHPNPNIRSKAVLMIGRGTHSVQWLKGRLAQNDPRIRANAIEAMWCVNSREAQILLGFALADANNRVVGNALLGLYQMGDCSVIPEIVKMARHEATLFRSTAAWVMGETRDRRFTETAVRMMVEPDATVRKRAFKAIGSIRAAAAQTGQGPEWRMAGVIQDVSAGQKIQRKVHLAVAAAGSAEAPAASAGDQPKILPTQFILTEGSQYVLSYKVTEKPAAEAMSVIFVLPRTEEPKNAPWNQGVSQCLAWKARSDLWCNLAFLQAGDPPAAPSPAKPPRPLFIGNAEALLASLGQTAGPGECLDLWETLGRCVAPDQAAAHGKRHVILVAADKIEKIAEDALISDIIRSRTSLQVISAAANPSVEDFCLRAKAHLQTFESPQEVPKLIQQAYLNLMARYEIVYQPISHEATVLRARVQTAAGWGEVNIPIPRP